jgi:7-carboxy-7-deazaguanine synthase
MIKICEIFTSIQGESTQAGRVCTLVRLSGCNLRCLWCDTVHSYAVDTGMLMTVGEIMREVRKTPAKLVEITGGEPLLQPDAVTLCDELLKAGYEVMLETNGTVDIGAVSKGVRRIVDIKCPSSGMSGSFMVDNLKYLGEGDEVKFVVASLDDAAWALEFCEANGLTERCPVIFSPVSTNLPAVKLAEWMLKNKAANIRFGMQLHKVLWGQNKRGV